MTPGFKHLCRILTVVVALSASHLAFADAKSLLDATAAGVEQQFKVSGSQVTVSRSDAAATPGVIIHVAAGEAGYPGIDLPAPDGKPWDLSAYGHVVARVANDGDKPTLVAIRVDNPGFDGGPWNTEQAYLKPGQTSDIKVIFGYAYGYKPAYPLKSNAIANIKLFTDKAKADKTIRLVSLTADGVAGEQPPVDPASIRTKPVKGAILGPDAQFNEKQVEAHDCVAKIEGSSLQLTFNKSKPTGWATLKPPAGKWDLRDAAQLRVSLKNSGSVALTPGVSIGEQGHQVKVTGSPIDPGATVELIVPFGGTKSWVGIPNSGDKTNWNGVAGTGSELKSDQVPAISISVNKDATDRSLVVQSIVADAPAMQTPDWLGKRPPVDGEWTKTFEDNFDGNAVDLTKWNNTGPNFWDKKSHWSKDNTIVADGVARMRYEKKTGTQNDEPNGKSSDYASGYLDTYGKWTQRYGYFEARMKLPTSPGLWPAFWVMPDRGVEVGEQWKRQDTANDAMEFDVMEHLTRWGPYRYNIAMHWDGYQKNHKQTGTEKIYIRPDADGFITAGLLWLPGQAIYYCNGQEVARWEADRISKIPSNMMFTLPVGGWDNNAIDDKQLPADFVIDYVRCWQRKDLADDAKQTVAPTKAQ